MLAEEFGKPITFLATAQSFDDEMSARIQKHKAERPARWNTLEITHGIAPQVSGIETEIVVLDCVTLLVSNLLMQFVEDGRVNAALFMQTVQREIEELLAAIQASSQHWMIVSNQVGLGPVPPYPMGRVCRDGLGWANQRLARAADEVLWMVAGIPVPIGIYRE